MRMTRSTLLKMLTAVAIGAALPGVATAQEAKKWVFVTGGDYAPYDMTNPDGTFYGFEIDLLAELAKRGKFDYEIRQMAWDGMMQSLMDGKFDAIVYAITITDERLKVVDFSDPYIAEFTSFAVSKESGIKIPNTGGTLDLNKSDALAFIETQVLPVLKGKVVGVEAGSTQANFMQQLFADKGVEVRQYVGVPQAYQDLEAGRVHAVVAADSNITDFVTKNPNAAEISGPIYSGAMLGHGLAVVVQKGHKELLDLINPAMKEMSADGSLKALSEKWFGSDMSPKP